MSERLLAKRQREEEEARDWARKHGITLGERRFETGESAGEQKVEPEHLGTADAPADRKVQGIGSVLHTPEGLDWVQHLLDNRGKVLMTGEPERDRWHQELGSRVMRVLESLPVPEQDVLLMRHVQGLSQYEMAELLQKSRSVVRRAVELAEQNFRRAFAEEFGG